MLNTYYTYNITRTTKITNTKDFDLNVLDKTSLSKPISIMLIKNVLNVYMPRYTFRCSHKPKNKTRYRKHCIGGWGYGDISVSMREKIKNISKNFIKIVSQVIMKK